MIAQIRCIARTAAVLTTTGAALILATGSALAATMITINHATVREDGAVATVEVDITYSCDADGDATALVIKVNDKNTSAGGRMMGKPTCDGKRHTNSATVTAAADSEEGFQSGDGATVVVVFLDDEAKPLEDSRQTAQLVLV
ncbi:hypothetical protein ACLMAJ_21660 [Nocardia sp. KC 131]|uniref:hypothetical protein n=1 Tax=Nocardia arseniciresistens TaxID=3392119 RepID=UPI00398F27E4